MTEELIDSIYSDLRDLSGSINSVATSAIELCDMMKGFHRRLSRLEDWAKKTHSFNEFECNRPEADEQYNQGDHA